MLAYQPINNLDELPHNHQEPISAPSPKTFFKEWRGLVELPKLLAQWPSLPKSAGTAAPILVVPGYNFGNGSTWLLRRFLRKLGHDARGWKQGTNDGNVWKLIPQLVTQVEELANETGQPIRLLGWSLGGYLAREAARERPALVTQVITLGSPIVGGPKYTLAAESYAKQGYDVDAIEAEVAERNKSPLNAAITTIFSRNDHVVAWQSCIDYINDNVQHFEVFSTHFGLGFDANVYRLIAQQLIAHHIPEALCRQE